MDKAQKVSSLKQIFFKARNIVIFILKQLRSTFFWMLKSDYIDTIFLLNIIIIFLKNV